MSQPGQHTRSQSTTERKSSSARSRLSSSGNLPPPSHSRKQSAPTVTERRTDRQNVTTRETVSVRTRSPLKTSTDSRMNARKSREGEKPNRPAERAPTAASAAPKKVDEQKPAWAPEASLIPHTTAPLASRVSIPPPASSTPDALQPQPLAELSLQAQEAAIIEDLLFVFMGFEGQYVRHAEAYAPREEKDRLLGPRYRILPGLDPSLRDLTNSMLKMASQYVALEAFVEVLGREEYGAVNHALCATVRRFLRDYLVLIAQLEHQMLNNSDFTLHLLNLHTKQTSHMLFQLYTMGIEVLKANGILEDDADDDSIDDTDNLEDILESLREGGNIGQMSSKKVCKGGSVLGLITKRLSTMSGDPPARELLTTLLRESSRPYMAMLNEWLHHGGIKDPHAEFLIREQKSIKRERLDQDYTDEYWEKRYTIRENLVPPQLESVKAKVLLAGKYLNVVRECGGVDVSKIVEDVPTTFDDPRFLDNVNSAYTYANSSLLNLLLTTHALPARLRSLKHYFFLDRSDFFSYFLELGTSELKKPAKLVNTGKLQSLLDIVLRQPGSVAAEDPYKEDVKVQINETGLTNWLMKIVSVQGMEQDAVTGNVTNIITPATQPSAPDDKDITGFDALVLDYSMPFPLSLVVSRVTMTRYQLLFRYLLSLRHLETLLANSWTDHNKVGSWRHRSSNRKIELWKRRAWTLRARMLVFVQQLIYYCTAEVIEPNWQGLMARLSSGGTGGEKGAVAEGGDGQQVKRTVDELMQDHIDFLATCLKECMLTNSKLLRINSKILATCTMFANFTSSLSRYLVQADEDLAAAHAAQLAASSADPSAQTAAGGSTATTSSIAAAATARSKSLAAASAAPLQFDPAKVDKMMEVLRRYEDNFSRHLKILLDTLNYLAATETVVLLSLCARLSTAAEDRGGPESFE